MTKHVCIYCLLLLGGAWQIGATENLLKVSYSFPEHNLTLHESVVVIFSVENKSPQTINFDLGQDRKENLLLTLTEPNGRQINLPQYGRDGTSVPGSVTLEPGKILTQELILNEWYDFKQTGAYKLELRFRDPVLIQAASGREQELTQEFSIGPRDAPSLQNFCEHLSEQIEGSGSYENSSQLALKLSYVSDPIAVPYLERALVANKLVEPIIIQGLERIADETASRVLISQLQGGAGETPVLARAALQRIQQRTLNKDLKEQIEHALRAASSSKS